MQELAERHCVPCRRGTPPLDAPSIERLLAQLDGWQAVDRHHLQKTYPLKDFAAALELANRIGRIAEEQDHHPELLVAWGRLEVRIWTHTIDALAESDFVLAAKCDRARAGLPPELGSP